MVNVRSVLLKIKKIRMPTVITSIQHHTGQAKKESKNIKDIWFLKRNVKYIFRCNDWLYKI